MCIRERCPSGTQEIFSLEELVKEFDYRNCLLYTSFDGVSFVIHGNTAAEEEAAAGVSEEEVKGLIAKAMKDFAATLMAE